jgi:hypothetical protein
MRIRINNGEIERKDKNINKRRLEKNNKLVNVRRD